MQILSRECVRDTLLAKRQGIATQTGLARSLYNLNVSILRHGQLAPHVETAMRANRFLEKQSFKRVAPVIVVVVRGGLIQEVRSTNPNTTVYIADYDADHEDPDEEARLCDAEERGNQSDMHIVY